MRDSTATQFILDYVIERHFLKSGVFMCLNLIPIKRKCADGRYYERLVPCGVCPECLKNRQSAIVVRSYIECCKRPKMCMFTLTYSDDKLPYSSDSGEPTLRREDIKNWKKEFRKLISSTDFSWILCGEYGPRTQRPHYHGLFFGLSDSDLAIAEKCWSDKFGFTVFKKVATASHRDATNVARYISKYVIKDDEFKTSSDFVEKPRIMSSIGFGYPDDRFFDWVLCKDKFNYDPFDAFTLNSSIISNVMERLYYPIGNFHYSIPTYVLRRKLYSKNLKGSLSPCALLQVVSSIKKFRSDKLAYAAYRQLESKNLEPREFIEEFNKIKRSEEISRFEKYCTQRENNLSTYKKSKF